MFGYVITNGSTLTEEQQKRFRAMYCGLCHVIKHRYGNLERFTLSYDMTFLALVLSALYEPEGKSGLEKCATHIRKAHEFITTPYMEYAADLNIMLAYHKCIDNWQDDRNPLFKTASKALEKAYRFAAAENPEKERAISEWMDEIRRIEASGKNEIDPPVNATGAMMAELFCLREDEWSHDLRKLGSGLGKYIYFMDAYEDLRKDLKHNKYNPLRSVCGQADYEELCKSAMTMMLAECADGYEMLPILRDADLIRNIIYSGVWAKYNYLQRQKAKHDAKGAK